MKIGKGKTIHLNDYNELLCEFMAIMDAQKSHPVFTEESRYYIYRKGLLKKPPRQIDVDVLQIACRVEYRMVPQTLMISLDNEKYEAPSYAMGKRVRIYKNMAGELMGELQEEDRKPFILKPYQFRKIDDFSHRPHLTYRQEREAAIKNHPANERKSKQLFMPVKPETIKPDSPFISGTEEPVFSSPYQARVYIGNALQIYGQTYADYADVFDEMLDADLRKKSIDEVLESIKGLYRAQAI